MSTASTSLKALVLEPRKDDRGVYEVFFDGRWRRAKIGVAEGLAPQGADVKGITYQKLTNGRTY